MRRTRVEDLPAVAPAGPTRTKTPGRPLPTRRLSLQQKTSFTLLALLFAAVACCGAVFYGITREIVRSSLQSQITSLSYGLASTLGTAYQKDHGTLSRELAQQKQLAGLDFIAVTDPDFTWVGACLCNDAAWQRYKRFATDVKSTFASRIGTLEELGDKDGGTFVMVVPILAAEEDVTDGSGFAHSRLLGYLHVGLSTRPTYDRLRTLHVSVLFTCMVVVLLVIPLASLVSKHVVVPVEELSLSARAFAAGNLFKRVEVRRRDEIGDLAEAFNAMADTVQRQQEDIRQINAGLEQKVQQRTAELEKVNGRLQGEISEKEDFLRAVSHDLNAPLRNIAGMASMLLIKYRATLAADAVQRLERIQKNVEAECELISELLELSRIKTRREKIETVDLHELVESVSEQFASDLETHAVRLTISRRLPVMRCEKARMRQVFQNLIDNGIKYMRPESAREITVSWEAAGGEYVLKFADTGIGIARDDLPNMFRVFRRAKNAAVMRIPGKGVGLASVKSIIENYGGRLWAESQMGVGTTLYIGIPVHCFQVQEREVAA